MSSVFIKKITNNINSIDLNNINKERKKYLDKLKNNRKYVSYAAWKLLHDVVLEKYHLDIEQLELSYNEYNKPYFKEFYFNISHTDDLIVVGISNNSIGVDIEKIRQNICLDKLAKKINAADSNPISVFTRFSLLEAYYKKIGLGLPYNNLKENILITHQQIIYLNNNKYVLSIDCDDHKIDKIEWR